MECHTDAPKLCAGIAIYRTNVAKRMRDPEVPVLPADRSLVFAVPKEFVEHHRRGPVSSEIKQSMGLLRPFGKGSSSFEHGYDLPLLVGHLEALADEEEDRPACQKRGPAQTRLHKVRDALALISEAMDMGREDG